MAVTYRTDGAWGTGKGGNLTAAEVDTNFHTLAQQIAALGTGAAPAEIASISLVGTQLTFTLDDGRTFGPFTVPRAAFRFREAWAPATDYAGNDVVTVAGSGLYLVRVAHTSAAAFDPALTAGGVPVYQLMFREPRAVVANVSAATWTPAITDAFAYVRFSVASTVTLPAHASVALPVGSEVHLRQGGADADALTIVGAGGVIVNKPTGYDLATDRSGAVVTAKKVAVDEWDVFGFLKVTP